MKKRALIIGLLVAVFSISCALVKKTPVKGEKVTVSNKEVRWYDFTTGYSLAKEQDKILLVDVYTDWCGWCKKMDRDTYTDSAVIHTASSDYICVKLNPEEDTTYTMEGQEYSALEIKNYLSNNRRDGYPSTYFLKTSNAKKVLTLSGYLGPKEFDKILRVTVPNRL